LQENTDKYRYNKPIEPAYSEAKNSELNEKEILKIIEKTKIDLLTNINSLKANVEENSDQAIKKYQELKDKIIEESKKIAEMHYLFTADFDNKFKKIESQFASIILNNANNELEIKEIQEHQLKNLSLQIIETQKENKLAFDKIDKNEILYNEYSEKLKESKAKLERTKIELNTKIDDLASKLADCSNEVKSFISSDNKNIYSNSKNNNNNTINLEDLEEVSNKIDELETKIILHRKKIEENQEGLTAEIEINKAKIYEKLNKIDQQSSCVFNYFEKKSHEIITNFEKKNEDIEDSIKLIVKKIEEIELINNNNNEYSKNKNLTYHNYSNKRVKIYENLEAEEILNNTNNKSKGEFSDENYNIGCRERIFNLTTIENLAHSPFFPKINACSVTNIIEKKYSLKGSHDQKIQFKFEDIKNNKNKNKEKSGLGYLDSDKSLFYCSFLNDKVFKSKNSKELNGGLDSFKNTELKTIILTKKFFKNLEYIKLNPIDFLLRKDKFCRYNKKFICESQKYSNYLEIEIKENEMMCFLNKINKSENHPHPINKRFQEEENLQAFENSIEDIKFDDTFSDFDQ